MEFGSAHRLDNVFQVPEDRLAFTPWKHEEEHEKQLAMTSSAKIWLSLVLGAFASDPPKDSSSSTATINNNLVITLLSSNLIIMLSRVAFSASRMAVRPVVATRAFSDAAKTAYDALQMSGYNSIDYTIKEDQMVFDAVNKFAAFNIGCLVTVDGCEY